MKKFVIAAALTVVATSAFAGGMAEPVMTMAPAEIIEGTGSSSNGVLLPILLLLLVAAAVSA